jgi:[acyl-carrier-protein] S-malonyltransferase
MGLDDAAVERVCHDAAGKGGDVVPANYNAPSQVVISGDVPSVEMAMELAREAGARKVVRLNVSGAFHSPLMRVAEAGLEGALDAVPIERPAFPIVSNVTARPVDDAVSARRLLVQQLTSPVRWTESMQFLVGVGVERFLELGPGTVLAGLLKRVSREVESQSIGTAEEAGAVRAA